MYDSERSHAIFLSRYRLLHYSFRKNYSFLLLLSWAAYLRERCISKRNERIILWSILRNCLPFSFLKNTSIVSRLFRISRRYRINYSELYRLRIRLRSNQYSYQNFPNCKLLDYLIWSKNDKIARYETIQRYTNTQIYWNFQGLKGLHRSRKIRRSCEKCCVRFDQVSLNRSKTLCYRCTPGWSFSVVFEI